MRRMGYLWSYFKENEELERRMRCNGGSLTMEGVGVLEKDEEKEVGDEVLKNEDQVLGLRWVLWFEERAFKSLYNSK